MLDRHFHYPHDLSHDEVLARIDAVLGRSPNAHGHIDQASGEIFPGLCDAALGFAHSMWRWCLEYDLNPAWCLISLQRERSLLGKKATSLQDHLFAFGYVGQDGPGQKNPRWNGLTPQLWLCIHQTAWIAGFGRPEAYGVLLNLRPGANRWNPDHPTPIQLFTTPNTKGAVVTPNSLAQHVIFTYTPHQEAEPTANALLHQFAPEFE